MHINVTGQAQGKAVSELGFEVKADACDGASANTNVEAIADASANVDAHARAHDNARAKAAAEANLNIERGCRLRLGLVQWPSLRPKATAKSNVHDNTMVQAKKMLKVKPRTEAKASAKEQAMHCDVPNCATTPSHDAPSQVT